MKALLIGGSRDGQRIEVKDDARFVDLIKQEPVSTVVNATPAPLAYVAEHYEIFPIYPPVRTALFALYTLTKEETLNLLIDGYKKRIRSSPAPGATDARTSAMRFERQHASMEKTVKLPKAKIYGTKDTSVSPQPPPPVPPHTPSIKTGWLPCSDTSVRHLPPTWTLPPVGPFMFPAPWNTPACRITDDVQGLQLEPQGMSYWRNINAHRNAPTLQIFVSINQQLVIFSINKATLQPRLMQRLDIPHTGEGIYWSAHDPNVLYLPWRHTLQRVNVVTNAWSEVFRVDEGTYLWQCHSSDDERTHSATVREEGSDKYLGWVICREGVYGPTFIPLVGEPDECAIDGSGDWLVAKETFAKPESESNRIFRTDRASTARIIYDPAGALGHSDMGAGFAIGENDWAPQPNALDRIELETLSSMRVYHGITWASGVGYVSLTNVHNRRFGVVSNATVFDHPRDNEIIAITIDGSLLFKPIAPSMSDLSALGGRDGYKKRPKANLCPYGEYIFWTGNGGGDGLIAFVAEVPRS